jgi:anion-transporting  ArsA/GET3 family ATPase
MRRRFALDVNTINDSDVQQAARRLVENQQLLSELGADQPDPKAAELQTLLSQLQEAQQRLAALNSQLTVQQNTVVNSVIGYQTALQRSPNTPKYKAAFIRALNSFVNNLSQAVQTLSSTRVSAVAKRLFAQENLSNTQDEFATIRQKTLETTNRVQIIEGLVKQNEQFIKQLTDVMNALGMSALLSPPQAPTGTVLPTPVPGQQPPVDDMSAATAPPATKVPTQTTEQENR